MNPKPPVQTYKALLWDYDYLLTKSDDECCFSLSEREVQILLAQLDYIGWKTRYKPTSTEIDQDVIDNWMGNLARKLMTGCCPDDEAIHRYLPDGTYQSSEDGGETWEDDPTGDPRHGAPLAPPLVGTPGDALRCAAADNVRDQYLLMRDNTIALLTAGTTLLAIVAGLVGLIGGILAVSVVGVSFGVILFGLSAALLSLTPESVEAQIDTVALNAFRCIIYCHMDANGRVNIGEFDDILSEIASTFDGFPETFFYSITASMTATGINNAATMGVSTAADCDDCEPCVETCADKFNVTTGILIGVFDGYLRVGAVASGGAMVVQIDTGIASECCQLLDYHDVVGGANIAARYHILCPLAIEPGNIVPGWGLEGCYNFLACQTTVGDGTYFEVEFLLNYCD